MNITDNFKNPSKAFFIKLGSRGKWEQSCIEQDKTLRLGFNEIPYELCIAGKWDQVKENLTKAGYRKVTDTVRQVACFYESGEEVLWVTFYGDRLWWCFSKREVKLLPDKSKTRPVIGQWQSTDLKGQPLEMSQLSGKLLRVQRFQGTICSVKEFDYLVQKIKGVVRKEVEITKKTLLELEQNIEAIIRDFTPKDFEILIDLIFRQAGWQRVSVLGETQKTLDLYLTSPITNERYGVQIKSEASLKDFEHYKIEFQNMQGYERFYFAVHTPLSGLTQAQETQKVKLLLLKNVARLVVKYGLADWVIAKAG